MWFRLFRKPEKPEAAHLRTGRWGEQLAEQCLREKGVKVLGRRVRVGRHDELDIVARDKEVLLFVEVKTRASEIRGRPAVAVNRNKQKALVRAAMEYMSQLKQKPSYFRFDIIEVIGQEGGPPPLVRHIERAFLLPPGRRVP
jgi:putative endonuclease